MPAKKHQKVVIFSVVLQIKKAAPIFIGLDFKQKLKKKQKYHKKYLKKTHTYEILLNTKITSI